MKVPVVENVLKLNDEVAQLNRKLLNDAGLFTINLIGAPGCGKTALLTAVARKLQGDLRMGVAVGDLATTRDADRLSEACEQVVQINTGKGCHLDSNQVRQALTAMDLTSLDFMVIENVGNLICPVGFDLGQDVKVGMFSVAEGDDKAAKHPYIVTEASLLILNKCDLLPYVPFDIEKFRDDIKQLNPNVPLLETSVQLDDFDSLTDWIKQGVAQTRTSVVAAT